jgi:hypothetical protein
MAAGIFVLKTISRLSEWIEPHAKDHLKSAKQLATHNSNR